MGLVLLAVAEAVDLVLSAIAYYGLGGAQETPGLLFILMPLGWLVLPVGFMFSAMQRGTSDRRLTESSIAVACAVVVLLQVPVGLLAFLSRGPSGDPLGDGILVLAFAIPGLLLVGYLWLTSRILGGRSRDASMEPEGGGA